MKRKFFNGFLLMALLVSSVSTFVSCKDYDEDMYVDLKSQLISSETTLQEALKKQKEELEALIAACRQACAAENDQNALTHATLEGMIKAAEQKIAQLENKDTDLQNQINATNSTISQVQSLLETAMKDAAGQYIKLDQKIDSLGNIIVGWNEEITNAAKNADDALALAIRDSIRLDAIDSLLANGAIGDEFLKENYYTKTEVDSLISDLRGEVENIDSIANVALQKALENAKTVGELEKSLDEVWEMLPELQEQLDAITARINNLLKNMITGIVVQASKNPVVGYLNTPLGVTSNILAVYYGTAENAYEFPATGSKYYATGENFGLWNQRNIEIIGALKDVEGYIKGEAGKVLLTADGEEGNAGTLYVTVNPNTVNFEGKTLDLVNSRDEEAPAVLSKLAKSDELLNFGYTRAAENGFYEAKATITTENVDAAKLNVNFADFKDEAVAMLKERSKNSVIAMGATIAQNIQNVAPAYAVKGTWIEDTTKHSVYSNYGVAALAVKPFSFNFAQDFQVNGKLPGVGKLQSVVGKMINKINIDLGLDGLDDLNIDFEGIDIEGLDFSTLNIKLTLRWDGDDTIKVVKKGTKEVWTVYGQNGMVTKAEYGGKTLTPRVDGDGNRYIDELDIKNEKMEGVGDKWLLTCYYYFGDEMEGIIEDLASQFDELPGNLADILNEVKDLAKIQTKIDDAKNDIKGTINDYITKVNNKLTQWINRAPAMLHLAMVAIDGNSNAGLLSQAQELPTKASTKLTLVPTSYSLEMLAPAYKKFVAVTDVVGVDLATAKTLAAKANQGRNMNKVVDSNVTCTLEGEKGKTYEVTYTAIDYAGKVAIRKYYVKF